MITDATTAQDALHTLYSHARRWAPGLETPFQIPTIRVRHLTGAAGQYVVGKLTLAIELAPQVLETQAVAAAVLCHEACACHHILDLSGLNTHVPPLMSR